MTHIFRRRGSLARVAGAAVVLGVTAAGLVAGAGAGVANAAPGERFFVSPGFGRTVPVRGTGTGADYRPVSVQFFTTDEGALRDVRVAVDGSTLHGIAELDLPAGCTYTDAGHLHESCAVGDVPSGSGGLSVGVRALAGATAGRHGQVAFTVTAANGTADPAEPKATVDVTVGDGADLAISDLGRSLKVTPGTDTTLPLRLTNVGSRDGKGVVLFVHDQYGKASLLGNHSNCLYEHYQNGQRGAFCTFPDAVIKPGERLELSDPFTVSMPAGSHGDEIQYGAGLADDAWIGTPTDGTRGTGDALTLVPAPAQKSGGYAYDPSRDIDEYNNLYYTRLDTGTVTDVSGVAATVHAVIGKDTPVTFAVRNSGTTTVNGTDTNIGGTVGVYVDFPDFVRVTKTPAGCHTVHGGPGGMSSYPTPKEPLAYSCVRTTTVQPGGTADFTFQVTALKAVPGMYAGFVAVADQDPTADERNDAARVMIDASAATAATPSSSPTANAPSANGDQSGTQLAATGSGTSTLWTAAGGAAVLAAGAATLLTLRRRSAARRG